MSGHPVPQVALEVMMKKNKEEASSLFAKAKELLAENRKIEVEMTKILSPHTMDSLPPPSSASMRPDPMGGLLHASESLVRSWKRRNKKNFKQLELDLMRALDRVHGRP